MSASDNKYLLDGTSKTPIPLWKRKMIDDTGSIIPIESYLARKNSYGKNNLKRIGHEDNIVIMISHSYISMYMVEGDAFYRLITHLDPCVKKTKRPKIPQLMVPGLFQIQMKI